MTPDIIWSLKTDSYIQNLANGAITHLDGTPSIQPSGPIAITAVPNPSDSNFISLQISNRNNGLHGLEILTHAMQFNPTNDYNITIHARRIGGGGATVNLATATPIPLNLTQAHTLATDPNFALNWDIDFDMLDGHNMRVQSENIFINIIFDDIVVTRTGTAVRPSPFRLSANGNPGVATTSEITLNFYRDIPNLQVSQISFNPRATGATLVYPYLTMLTEDQYVLHIGGANRWGYVDVAINGRTDVLSTVTPVMIYHELNYFIPNNPLRSYFPWINDPHFRNLMPSSETLNDPFQFFVTTDGQSGGFGEVIPNRVVTQQDWENRRAEIRDLIMYYYIGHIWHTPSERIIVNTDTRPGPESNEMINITVNEYRTDGTPVSQTFNIAAGVWLPSEAQLTANGFADTGGPIIISMSPIPVNQRDAANQQGIGVAQLFGQPGRVLRDGVYFDLFPFVENNTDYNSGTLAATAWLVSRLLDVFELNPEWNINPNMSVVMGIGHQGNRALIGAVMDDRVALALPIESGGDGGLAPFRHTHVGRINFWANNRFVRALPRHETPRTGNAMRTAGGAIRSTLFDNRMYSESTWLVPFDTHFIAALQAGDGRALIAFETDNCDTTGHHQRSTGAHAVRNVIAAANEVFAFLGYDGYATMVQRTGMGHILDTDYDIIFDAMRYMFRGLGDELATHGRSPVEVDSWAMPWARPDAHYIWTETQLVTEGLPANVVAHTNAPFVYLIRWSHGDENTAWGIPTELDRWRVRTVDGIATFNLSAPEVGVGRYELHTVGGNLQQNSAFFMGVDLHTALIQSYNMGDTGGVQFGFVSMINSESVRVYTVNGMTETHFTNYHSENIGGNWVSRHGIRPPAIPGDGENRWWSLRHLQFQAVPGFTFQLNLQQNINNITVNANNVNDISWAPSATVQNIGVYPDWNQAGGVTMANRTTTFDRTIVSSVGYGEWSSIENAWTRLDVWELTFSAPINPRDFGIGFDFSSDFDLVWSADNAILTIHFNDFKLSPYRANNDLNMIIMRIRNEGAPVGGTRASRIENMYNGIKQLSLDAPTRVVTAVEMYPKEVTRYNGQIQQFDAAVLGEWNPPPFITWSITGDGIASGTMILPNGRVIICDNQMPTIITVMAVSQFDSNFYDTAILNILEKSSEPEMTVDSVMVTPDTTTLQSGETKAFTATVEGTLNPPTTVVWTIVGNAASGTSISDAGVLTVAVNQLPTTLNIRATSTFDATMFGSAVVIVSAAEMPTDKPSEPSSENTTDIPTDGTVDKPTEPPTDGTADKPTEPPTDSTADKPTEPPTNDIPEKPTELPTDNIPEIPTPPDNNQSGNNMLSQTEITGRESIAVASATQTTIDVSHGVINIPVRITNGRANITMSTTVRNTIIRESVDYVVFDLSSIEYVTTVVISRRDWSQFADADLGITFIMPGGTVTFDAYAAKSIRNQSTGGNISVTIDTVDTLTAFQQVIMLESAQVFRITVLANRINITEFDGTLTVVLPFDGDAPVLVWRFTDGGIRERLPATFDREYGLVTFTTNRLSMFIANSLRTLSLRQILHLLA